MIIYLSLLETDEEKKSFEKIYEENYLKMYHIALGIFKNQHDAENAVHESFLSIAEKYKIYSTLTCSEMTGLCVTIVKNKSIDSIRKRNHMSEAEIEKLVLSDGYIDRLPEDSYERKENAKLIQKALSELPEILKETLVLRYYYNYSYHQIASIMGVNEKAVEVRLYRGKKKMKEIIDEENGK